MLKNSDLRIYIVGPTASGKTYLAKKLSEKLGVEPTSLDYVFYKHVKDKSRIEVSEKEWRQKLGNILNRKTWIIEGVNLIPDVLDDADKVIYLHPRLINSLIDQWVRYMKDPIQRKQHGFKNNLELSKFLIRQYRDSVDPTREKEIKYTRLSKTSKELKKYKDKTTKLTTRKQVNDFIRNFV